MWKKIVIIETVVIAFLIWSLFSLNENHKIEMKNINIKVMFIKKMKTELDKEMDSINVEKSKLKEFNILENGKSNLKEIKAK